MTAALTGWWRERTRRERVLLALMLALAGGVLFWLLIMRPLAGWTEDSRIAYQDALLQRAEAEDHAGELARIRAMPVAALPRPLDQAVLAVAVQGGFSDAAAESESGGTVRLAIPAVRVEAFFPWLAETVQRHGLVVDTLSVTPNSDHTLSVAVIVRDRRT
jgi:general secretion pathway protein M